MSLSYCNDCEQIVEGNTARVYLTADLTAAEDGEYVTVCNNCGNDGVVEVSEDGYNREGDEDGS